MIDVKLAKEKITDLKSNFRRALNIGDTVGLICKYNGFKSWTNEEFEEVMDRLMNYDNYPENLINSMEAIYSTLHKTVRFFRDCGRCYNSGYRYYKTFVKSYSFENKGFTKTKRTCVAACGCEHGRVKKEEYDLPWYNDVIKRDDVEPVEDSKQERQEELLEPLRENYEQEAEELPFVI